MKWMLIWWIVNPGHVQVMHLERGFDSEAACQRAESLLPENSRHHCSME
jgi:hypothetical protein